MMADSNYSKYVDHLMMKTPDVNMIEFEEGQNSSQQQQQQVQSQQ